MSTIIAIQLPDLSPTIEECKAADEQCYRIFEASSNAFHMREFVLQNMVLRRVLLQATAQIHRLTERGI